MKAQLLTILLSKAGIIAAGFAGLVVATVVSLAAKAGFDLTEEQTTWLTTSITAGVAWLISEWAKKASADGTEAVQRALSAHNPALTIDRYAGPITAEAAANAAKGTTPIIVRNEILSESTKQAIKTFLEDNPDVLRSLLNK